MDEKQTFTIKVTIDDKGLVASSIMTPWIKAKRLPDIAGAVGKILFDTVIEFLDEMYDDLDSFTDTDYAAAFLEVYASLNEHFRETLDRQQRYLEEKIENEEEL